MQWKTLRENRCSSHPVPSTTKKKIPRQPSEDFCGSALPTANVFSRHNECQRTVQRWKRPFHWRKPVSDHSFFVPQLPQTRTCRGEAPPSCCRKTVRSLKSPTGAFIVPFCSTNVKLSNSVRCFALWHFYTLLNHSCNICNGIGAVILEPF